MAPQAAKAAKARACPTVPSSFGAHQQPIKKPKKCDDPSKPICVVVKPKAIPDNASNGLSAPELSCKKAMDRNSAAKEMSKRI